MGQRRDLAGPAVVDGVLVARYVGGDRSALGEIYERYGDRVHDLCLAMLGTEADAADAFQDTFLTAAHKLDQLRDPDRLRPWLYSVARNHCRARIRARGRTRPDATTGADVGVEVDMTVRVERDELAEIVAAARVGLNERDREVLDLHLRHGLEGDDLADVLGVTTQNAYKLVQRVRDRVERSLGALLVARHRRRDCDELQALLGEWDGEFTPLLRKRISRHIDDCDVCADNRRLLLEPGGLASAMPFTPAPTGPATAVAAMLAADTVASPARPIDRWRRDGFPGRRRGRRPMMSAVAMLSMLLVLTGALLAVDVLATGDRPVEVGDAPPVSVEGVTVTAPGSRPVVRPPATPAPTTVVTTIPATAAPTTPAPAPPPTASPPVPPTPAPTTAPPVPLPPVPTLGPPPTSVSVAPSGSSTTTTSTTTSTTSTTTTTTTVPFRNAPPRVLGIGFDVARVFEHDPGARCASPDRARLRVDADDDRRVVGVEVRWTIDQNGVAGTVTTSLVGGAWVGDLLVPLGSAPPNGGTLSVTAVALDEDGARSALFTGPGPSVSPC